MRWKIWWPVAALTCATASHGLLQAGSVIDAEGCLPFAQVKTTSIRSDRRIDFKLRDGGQLRNDLPANCRSLTYEQKFNFTTAGERICPGHEIFVPNSSWAPGEYQGSTCSLGQFSHVTDGGQ